MAHPLVKSAGSGINIRLRCAFVVSSFPSPPPEIAAQYQRVVIFRPGKYNRTSGPGLFFTINEAGAEQNSMTIIMMPMKIIMMPSEFVEMARSFSAKA